MAEVDFSKITEVGGTTGSRAQLARACNRYYYAGELCDDKDVLEVACGVGQGLGYLARRARRVTGLDIDETNIQRARSTYRDRANIDIVLGDAQALPFADGALDVVLLYEAIYYLPDPERFAREARRVLRPGGVVIVCTTNKDLPDFVPGAFTHRYFGATELVELFRPLGFEVELFGESPLGPATLKSTAFGLAKTIAGRLHLIPGSMKGKTILKRIVFGPLVPLPHEVEPGMAPYTPPERLPLNGPVRSHLILYCVARVPVTPRPS